MPRKTLGAQQILKASLQTAICYVCVIDWGGSAQRRRVPYRGDLHAR